MKKLLTSISIAASLVVATGAANAAGPNLIQNGSFEQTTMTSSGQIGDSSSPNVTGWVDSAPNSLDILYFSGAAATGGGVATPKGLLVPLWAAQASPDGGHFVAIDGDSTVRTSLTQSISGLTAGDQYQLSFWYAGAQFSNMTGPTTDTWQVSFGDQSQTATALSNGSKGFTGWVEATMTFTAKSATQALSFLAVGTPTGLPPVSLLDGVSLVDMTPPVTPVPEPATWATMILGLGAIGASLRRRSKGDDAT